MNPSFQLIDRGWDKVIGDGAALKCKELLLVSPFIKLKAVKRLLTSKTPELIRVITRFHPGEMCLGVNDTEALRLLLECGAKIRGIRGLHAKVYLFGDQRAVVTSANITEAAFLRNHEFGFVSSEGPIIKRCREYFDQLWQRAGCDLDLARLETWEKKIAAIRLAGTPPLPTAGLKDEGAEAGLLPPAAILFSEAPGDAPNAYVKFFGQGHDRAGHDFPVLDEVDSSQSHWACTYPANKRPRSVQDGDVMFMARLVENPHDVIIYGRAIGLRHVDGRDDATASEIAKRSWKKDWPAYVRVHSAEFVSGILENGVSLSLLMDDLRSDAFASTQRNARAKTGENTDPRRALMQKAHVQLTQQAFAWLEQRLQKAFDTHGKLAPAELAALDWPSIETTTLDSYVTWLMSEEGLKENTAKEYANFLKRCIRHYAEVISLSTVPNEATANQMISRIMDVVQKRGRWTNGAFNERDITQNVRPALRAYGRFSEAKHKPVDRL
jgi:hypothetical protein